MKKIIRKEKREKLKKVKNFSYTLLKIIGKDCVQNILNIIE